MFERSRHGFILPPPHTSLLQIFGSLPEETRAGILDAFDAEEIEELQADWRFLARREQLPPLGEWNVWVAVSGRGWGKTKAGAEYLIHLHKQGLVGGRRSAIIAPTANDVWSVIVEGHSGIMACAPESFRPKVHTMRRMLTWPDGSTTELLSGEEPDRIRGLQFGFCWIDELAAMAVRQDQDEADRQLHYLWSMMRMALRLGEKPEVVVTTTPRPRALIRQLVKEAQEGNKVVVTTGSTYDNAANLPAEFVEDIRRAYEGTRLGKQEIYAEILENMTGGLWTAEMIEACQTEQAPEQMKRIVVAVDPPITSTSQSDACGIVVAGLGYDGKVYVLGDFSFQATPTAWVHKVLSVFDSFKADLILAEKNQGGDMVEHAIKSERAYAPVRMVWATRAKILRAEPVAIRYEKGEVKHVGHFLELEEEMLKMAPGRMKKSPNRVDSMVYAVTELAPAMRKRIGFFGRRLTV